MNIIRDILRDETCNEAMSLAQQMLRDGDESLLDLMESYIKDVGQCPYDRSHILETTLASGSKHFEYRFADLLYQMLSNRHEDIIFTAISCFGELSQYNRNQLKPHIEKLMYSKYESVAMAAKACIRWENRIDERKRSN